MPRFYAELGLVGKAVAVWLYEGTLRVEYESVLLARYGVVHERDDKHIRDVHSPRLATTRYRSPQLVLFELKPADWLLYVRLPGYVPRKQTRLPNLIQLRLPLASDQVNRTG